MTHVLGGMAARLRPFSVGVRRRQNDRDIGQFRVGIGARLINQHRQALAKYGRTLLRSEEHTSELQSLMRISYAVFCLKKKKHTQNTITNSNDDDSTLIQSQQRKTSAEKQ